MFVDFFYFLRDHGLKVSIGEWLLLLEGMQKGLHHNTLHGFYILCRAIVVRNETEYDLFDVAFEEYFHDLPPQSELPKPLQHITQQSIQELELESQHDADAIASEHTSGDENASATGMEMPGSGSSGGKTACYGRSSRKTAPRLFSSWKRGY